MSVSVHWLLEGHVIFFRFEGALSLPEMQNAAQEALAMMRRYPEHTVHFLHDRRKMKSFPFDLKGILDAWSPPLHESNMGYIVTFAGLDPASAWVSEVVTGIAKIRYKHFKNKELALDFCRSFVPMLPDPDEAVFQQH